jgi:hypothetical protein
MCQLFSDILENICNREFVDQKQTALHLRIKPKGHGPTNISAVNMEELFQLGADPLGKHEHWSMEPHTSKSC